MNKKKKKIFSRLSLAGGVLISVVLALLQNFQHINYKYKSVDMEFISLTIQSTIFFAFIFIPIFYVLGLSIIRKNIKLALGVFLSILSYYIIKYFFYYNKIGEYYPIEGMIFGFIIACVLFIVNLVIFSKKNKN